MNPTSDIVRFAANRAVIERLEGRLLLSAITNWSSRGPGGGGAFFSPSFSPYNSSELYAVSDMSGLYHTTNLGQSWTMADFRQIQGGIGSQVQFTSDPNILYTLDYSDNSSGGGSTAPTKSTDGGATWHQLSGWNGSNDQAFSLFANPASTTQLLVSDYGTLYFSGNGGTSFTPVFTDSSGNGCYIGGVYWNGSNIYVGTDVGLLVSTNGGTSFALSTATGLPSGSSILSFTGATSGGVTRLAAITANSGDVFAGLEMGSIPSGSYSGTWTLTPGNASWTAATTVPSDDGPLIISMARTDINDIYIGGTNYSLSVPTIAKSTDGGHTFADVLNTTNNGNIATGWQGAGGDRGWSFDQLTEGFEVDPANSNNLAFTGFGYLHLSTNGGQSWQQAYVNPADQNPAGANTPQHKAYHGIGLEDTSTLYLNWANSQTITAGYTDIYGVRSTDGGQSWSFPTGISAAGNTVYCITKVGSTLYAATSNIHDIYQSTHVRDSSLSGSGKILYSTDSGATWNVLHSFSAPAVWVATDPNDANRLYVSLAGANGVGGISTTDNLSAGASSTWTSPTEPATGNGHAFNIDVLNNGTVLATFSGQLAASGGFTKTSGVFSSSDHGSTWTNLTGAGMTWWTKDLTVDPTDPTQQTWYASVRFAYGTSGASGTGGLYRTTNGGQNWTQIFQSIGAESAAINPSTGEMYLATEENGLYYCANPKAATPTFTQTNYPFRQPERIFFNPFNSNEVWITSFGYGLVVGSGGASPVSIGGNNAYVELDANPAYMDVWNNATASGSPTQYLLSSVSSVTYTGAAGNDVLVVNFAGGDPFPSSGLSYAGSAGGQNTLAILGTSDSDTDLVNATTITVAATFGSAPITYSGVTSITFNGGSGSDVLTQAAQPGGGASIAFISPTSSDTLNVNAGSFAFPASGGGIAPINLGTLSIAAGAVAHLTGITTATTKTVLVLGNLSLASSSGIWTSTLDLGGNDLIVKGGGASGLTQIFSQLAEGYNAAHGYWNGAGGILSAAAAGDTAFLTTLGVMLNSNGAAFDQQPSGTSDVLVKHTYYGDADLSGLLNGGDYQQIDTGFGLHHTGWSNGDFNYDGVVNGSDYALIDNEFNELISRGLINTPLARMAASASLVAGSPFSPVPIFADDQQTPLFDLLDDSASVRVKRQLPTDIS